MLGIFNSINIDGMDFYRPSDFTLTKQDIYAGEYTTCTGDLIADRIGWKYADFTLSWDTLPDAMLKKLAGISGSVNLVFTDSDGQHTESIIRAGFQNTPTRLTGADGLALWKDVNVEIRFITAHAYTE